MQHYAFLVLVLVIPGIVLIFKWFPCPQADGAQMVNEQFQACNELRPNLETAAEIVLDQVGFIGSYGSVIISRWAQV